MFLMWTYNNSIMRGFYKGMQKVVGIRFSRGGNLICLFIGVRFKIHFPLIGLLANILQFLSIKNFKKREVSSRKNLHIEVVLSGRSLK